MAITVGIFAMSGGGKSTSLVINPDGKYDPANYAGMDLKNTIYFNCDKKKPPFKSDDLVKGINYFETSDSENIIKIMKSVSGKGLTFKSIIIDTINAVMVDKEMNESKKLTYDKWYDLAKDIYELIYVANALRDDLVIYLLGHVTIYTDVDGNESKCLITNGKKLEKIKLESKLPVVLFGTIDRGNAGENKHYFETQSYRSTAKTPLGMFKDFQIPNSLKLVDTTIREYYGI